MSDDTFSPAMNQIRETLVQTENPQQCLELAAAADAAGDTELSRTCLERAVALDRFCQPALLNLAALALSEDDALSAFSMLEEAARISPLPEEVEPLREQLFTAAREVPELSQYLRLVGRTPVEPAGNILSIVVVTGGFPPHDANDSAHELWELVRGLRARGHKVNVLTTGGSDQSADPSVTRDLRLCATSVSGKAVPIENAGERQQRVHENIEHVREAVTKWAASLVIAANLELLDIAMLAPALERNVPVIHLLRSPRPSFTVDDLPREAHYCIAPVSEWTGTSLRNSSYETARMDSIHPAMAQDRFFRLFLADTGRLRICFVGPIQLASGTETFVRALVELKQQGVDFNAELAGDVLDLAMQERLTTLLREHELENFVLFTDAPSYEGRAGLFARHNVLVFAPQIPEPFGLSQVQAMASGLVVVSNGTGGSKEIVRDEVDGLLFAPGDPSALAAKLASLARNPDLLARLQRQAQSRSTVFSTENAVLQIETLAGDLHAMVAANSSE